ncbi:pentatricopeptide repeat-containing protein [Tanacetum coccineum]
MISREDVEVCYDDLLRKLKGNGMGITDPFAILEDSKEKYPIYDDLTHWKLKKPNLGEKFPTVDKFKECLTYYALANRFSLYFERSNKEKIVAKCGQRKEVIRNATKFALNECKVTIQDHYGFLRSYAKALADLNEGSTVKVGVIVNPDEKTYFDRFYVCFKALKDGWKIDYRRIIALDGCF